MKRSHKALLAIIIVVVVGIFVVEPFGLNFVGFYWDAEIGDTYSYSVDAAGENTGGSYGVGDNIPPLNGSTINVTVNNLPPLGGVFTRSQFTSDIIQSIKVNGTFSNGTPLTRAISHIIPTISGCILPCGAWWVIDSLYHDSATYDFGLQSRVAVQHGSYFEISYSRYGMDDVVGWSGHVSLTTGVPSYFEWTYSHGGNNAYVRLTLVE